MRYSGCSSRSGNGNEAHLYVPKAESRGVTRPGHRWNTINHRRARGRLRGHEQHEVEPARRASSGRRRALTSAPRPLSTPRGSGTLRLTLWRTDGLAERLEARSRPSKPRAWPAETRTRAGSMQKFSSLEKRRRYRFSFIYLNESDAHAIKRGRNAVNEATHRQILSAPRLHRRPPQCARLRDGILFFPPRRRDYFILPVSKRGPGTAKGERFASSTNKGTRQSGESRARPCGWERIGKGNREVRRIIAREWRGRAQNGCFSITAYDQLCCRAC